MPMMNNRVLASNQITAQNQAQKQFRNKYGDTVDYTYRGLGVVNGRYFNSCFLKVRANGKVKVLKSMEAAQNFINRERKETTIFGEI